MRGCLWVSGVAVRRAQAGPFAPTIPFDSWSSKAGQLTGLGDLLSLWQPLSKELENSAGLGLIRACNTLLGRLSKADDAALRGRILNFMASAFSLSARGGVNLRGEFNVGNATDFEVPVGDEDEESAMEGVVEEDKSEPEDEKEEGEEEEEDKKKTDVGESRPASLGFLRTLAAWCVRGQRN